MFYLQPIVDVLISANGVIYNAVRLSNGDNIMRVRKFGFIEALKPFLSCTRIGLKVSVDDDICIL